MKPLPQLGVKILGHPTQIPTYIIGNLPLPPQIIYATPLFPVMINLTASILGARDPNIVALLSRDVE